LGCREPTRLLRGWIVGKPFSHLARSACILVALRAIVASFAVHAGVAAGLVAAGRGGHAVPGAPVTMTAEILEIDTSAETVPLPMPESETPKVEERSERANVVAPPPDHTHPYPVPGHDARPHDPSQPHSHESARDDHDHDHDHDQAEAAAAAAVVANDSAAKMPVFAMASGSGSMTAGSTRVAADAKGDGNGNGTASVGSANEGAGANVTYPVTGVSVPAKLVASATAAYPSDARADDVEGDVGLEIVVDAQGQVVDARVSKRAGHGFDESALNAIRRYRFSAAQREGRNVRVRMPWNVQFRLR
jgi:TonB family protein